MKHQDGLTVGWVHSSARAVHVLRTGCCSSSILDRGRGSGDGHGDGELREQYSRCNVEDQGCGLTVLGPSS